MLLKSPFRDTITLSICSLFKTVVILLLFSLFFLIALQKIFISNVNANTLGEEFLSSSKFSNGMLVGLENNDPNNIELADITTAEYLIGVVSGSGSNTVTYSKDNSDVTVSLSGEVVALVSDVNGQINAGDLVSPSWLEGVGMKSLEDGSNVKLLGVAIDSFDDSSAFDYGSVLTPYGEKQIRVGSIRVKLTENSYKSTLTSSYTPFEILTFNLTGKRVSLLRVLIGSLIFIIAITIAGILIGSSVHASFISVGRNPLSSTAINRSLLQISVLSVVIVLIGTTSAYVVLVL